MLTAENINRISGGKIIGRKIIFLDSTTSTNDVAFKAAKELKNPDGIVVVADSQTAGRGRQGRKWVSPPGVNLYFTVLLKAPTDSSAITFLPAVASARAIRDHTGLRAEIKWPNDILIGGRKAGGILTEMKRIKAGTNFIAIGIGINVNMSRDSAPVEIRPFTTSLKAEKGSSINRIRLLEKLFAELEIAYNIILQGDKGELIRHWSDLNCTLGNHVRIMTGNSTIDGRAENINESGELIVRLDTGEIKKFCAGDVSILKDDLAN